MKTRTFTAGKFHYTVDGRSVIVTKDSGSSIITIQVYTYKSEDEALDSAWLMQQKQLRA